MPPKERKVVTNERIPMAADLPPYLRKFCISLEPWTLNGKTYKVIGTETSRKEIIWGADGLPEIVEVKEHRQHVLCVETEDEWWIPHDRVREQQIKAGLKL